MPFLYDVYNNYVKIGKVMANKCFTESTLDLTCSYNLGGDTLYSVKWYKGRHEFYRYMPTENPIIKTFPVKNMKINVSTSLAKPNVCIFCSIFAYYAYY